MQDLKDQKKHPIKDLNKHVKTVLKGEEEEEEEVLNGNLMKILKKTLSRVPKKDPKMDLIDNLMNDLKKNLTIKGEINSKQNMIKYTWNPW